MAHIIESITIEKKLSEKLSVDELYLMCPANAKQQFNLDWRKIIFTETHIESKLIFNDSLALFDSNGNSFSIRIKIWGKKKVQILIYTCKFIAINNFSSDMQCWKCFRPFCIKSKNEKKIWFMSSMMFDDCFRGFQLVFFISLCHCEQATARASRKRQKADEREKNIKKLGSERTHTPSVSLTLFFPSSATVIVQSHAVHVSVSFSPVFGVRQRTRREHNLLVLYGLRIDREKCRRWFQFSDDFWRGKLTKLPFCLLKLFSD